MLRSQDENDDTGGDEVRKPVFQASGFTPGPSKSNSPDKSSGDSNGSPSDQSITSDYIKLQVKHCPPTDFEYTAASSSGPREYQSFQVVKPAALPLTEDPDPDLDMDYDAASTSFKSMSQKKLPRPPITDDDHLGRMKPSSGRTTPRESSRSRSSDGRQSQKRSIEGQGARTPAATLHDSSSTSPRAFRSPRGSKRSDDQCARGEGRGVSAVPLATPQGSVGTSPQGDYDLRSGEEADVLNKLYKEQVRLNDQMKQSEFRVYCGNAS